MKAELPRLKLSISIKVKQIHPVSLNTLKSNLQIPKLLDAVYHIKFYLYQCLSGTVATILEKILGTRQNEPDQLFQHACRKSWSLFVGGNITSFMIARTSSYGLHNNDISIAISREIIVCIATLDGSIAANPDRLDAEESRLFDFASRYTDKKWCLFLVISNPSWSQSQLL